MPQNKKATAEVAQTETPNTSGKAKFSSFDEFERKMFPNAVARRSLQRDGAAAQELGDRLAEALAEQAERRMTSRMK